MCLRSNHLAGQVAIVDCAVPMTERRKCMRTHSFFKFKPLQVLLVVGMLALLFGVLPAQVTVSAGPLSLYEVKTIYIAPSSDEFTRLLKSRLDRWSAVRITTQVEEADAMLTCQTETRFMFAKVVVRVIDADVRLVDRHTQKSIWSTKKSTSWDDRLADDIVEQLKRDREKSFGHF